MSRKNVYYVIHGKWWIGLVFLYSPYPYSGWSAPNSNKLGLYALSEPITTFPIPPALWPLGSGLFGIVGIRKKFKK